MNASRKAMSNNDTITPGQIKKIHTLASALRIDDDLYRGILINRFNTETSKTLSGCQADQLIAELEGKAVQAGVWKKRVYTRQYESLEGRLGFASSRQLALIESTWNKVSRMETAELKAKSLRKFILKVAGVSDLRFLKQSGAGKVIIALRSMEKRKKHSSMQREKGENYGEI
jgi:hypothetical protein